MQGQISKPATRRSARQATRRSRANLSTTSEEPMPAAETGDEQGRHVAPSRDVVDSLNIDISLIDPDQLLPTTECDSSQGISTRDSKQFGHQSINDEIPDKVWYSAAPMSTV
jgi:hypothetical protein